MASVVWLLLRSVVSVLRAADTATADLDGWKLTVRTKFPRVPQLTTAQLAAWLADTNRPRPVLLDVRPQSEFAISHLPGARQVDPNARPADIRRLLPTPQAPVVVYCSVGWRSSALGERLIKDGLTNVANLEGSLFAWANEDRPLEADGKPASRVHPYNRTFGKLLRPEKRAEP
jgi:rhodanese-related sulfurtransferase